MGGHGGGVAPPVLCSTVREENKGKRGELGLQSPELQREGLHPLHHPPSLVPQMPSTLRTPHLANPVNRRRQLALRNGPFQVHL